MPKITVNLDESVFNPVYFPYLKNDNRIQIYYGGASSGKSVFVAQKKIYQHLNSPGVLVPRKTLVVRKVQNTIRHSAFAELVNVIDSWGLGELFRAVPSRLEIHRRDGKTSFICAGLDDVQRLKSIQGVTDIWFEEPTEATREDFQQLNLRLRGRRDLPKEICLSFNPISALHWLKATFFDIPNDRVSILKTTYRDNKFLDEEDREQIEWLREQDPQYYQIYGLGEWGELGDHVYSNYVVEEFDQYKFNADEIYQGLDWGFIHPSAAVKMAFRDGVIYIMSGIKKRGLTNTDFMGEAEKVLDKDLLSVGDSAEPDRIEEFSRAGWYIKPAKKGKDSVGFGIDFCRRHKIVIHPTMMDFYKEIQGYCYRKDKDDVTMEEPIKVNDHYMSAMRYGLEPAMRDEQVFDAAIETQPLVNRRSKIWG